MKFIIFKTILDKIRDLNFGCSFGHGMDEMENNVWFIFLLEPILNTMIKRKPVGRTQSYGNKRETYIPKGLAILWTFWIVYVLPCPDSSARTIRTWMKKIKRYNKWIGRTRHHTNSWPRLLSASVIFPHWSRIAVLPGFLLITKQE